MEEMTYKTSGVDIQAGHQAVERMKPLVAKTLRKEVLTGLGGFGGLFKLDTNKYHEPVLVSGTDGVGTKLKIAFEADIHNTIGIDLVAMCVNDIICSGAEPLFFLDYISCGKLYPEKVSQIVEGISEGCQQAGASLIGGETAEMPGLYSESEYDLAGFAVGVVDKKNIIDGSAIQKGDQILGLPSSGFHSNGYSLIRQILFTKHDYRLDQVIDEFKCPLKDLLLSPTQIYYSSIKDILKSNTQIKGLAHITGGGLYGNTIRIIPEGLDIRLSKREIPELFRWIQRLGEVSDDEMSRVFNLGIGMVVIVPPDDVEKVMDSMNGNAVLVGEVYKP
ncbi:MAG: phosphoribosylformylglycinamidine cyclo-ligase [bacterium]|nr:MAG: phosphoribosylformylglycinamidine cyclo-ligase [bacterium]